MGVDLDSGLADEPGLSHSAHRLQPAEDLFHTLSFALADLGALGVVHPPIAPRRLASVNAGDVRLVYLVVHTKCGCQIPY